MFVFSLLVCLFSFPIVCHLERLNFSSIRGHQMMPERKLVQLCGRNSHKCQTYVAKTVKFRQKSVTFVISFYLSVLALCVSFSICNSLSCSSIAPVPILEFNLSLSLSLTLSVTLFNISLFVFLCISIFSFCLLSFLFHYLLICLSIYSTLS